MYRCIYFSLHCRLMYHLTRECRVRLLLHTVSFCIVCIHVYFHASLVTVGSTNATYHFVLKTFIFECTHSWRRVWIVHFFSSYFRSKVEKKNNENEENLVFDFITYEIGISSWIWFIHCDRCGCMFLRDNSLQWKIWWNFI